VEASARARGREWEGRGVVRDYLTPSESTRKGVEVHLRQKRRQRLPGTRSLAPRTPVTLCVLRIAQGTRKRTLSKQRLRK